MQLRRISIAEWLETKQNKFGNCRRTLYRTAKQSKAVKFYSLYDKVWRTDVLREAWKQVQANRGAPGVDGESIEGIVSRGEEEAMLSRLQEELRAKTIAFSPCEGWISRNRREALGHWGSRRFRIAWCKLR
jgi:retron-type reverse transcriptase